METKTLPHPKRFLIQLHITNKCNLGCKHCSQASGKKAEEELTTQQFLDILDDYFDLLRTWNIKGHINISGGEPFMRKDIFCLLKKIHENKPLVKYSILTNGTLITKETAKHIKELQPSYAQVSLEGMEITNDAIRGKGTFKKIIKSVQILLDENIRTFISFTAHKDNYKDFPKVVELGKQLGVEKVWTERLCPCGRGLAMKQTMLEPLELEKFYHSNYELSKKLSEEKSKTSTPLVRSLCYLVDKKNEYICSAGTILVIMPNGDVFPCTRLPVVVGNTTRQTLFEIWYSNNFLWRLRDKNEMNNICKNCSYFEHCCGGARCISYAYFGTPFAPDPQCWIAFKKLSPQNRPKENPCKEAVKLNKMILVPKTNHLDIEPYLKEETNNLYYITKSEKVKLVKTTDYNALTGHPYVNIDLSKVNLNLLSAKILKNNPKIILISFELNHNQSSQLAGSEIIDFLNRLKEKNINFKITKPLPKCLFSLNYEKVINRFGIPKNCFECLELFIAKNGRIYSCKKVNKKGPDLKYTNDRYQIYEYFKYFYERLIPKRHCSKCRYYLRGNCVCACF